MSEELRTGRVGSGRCRQGTARGVSGAMPRRIRERTGPAPVVAPEPVAVGTMVGAYRVAAQIGFGGMGLIYRAVHTLLDRPAAIKVLRPELATDAPSIDRLRLEARATTQVRHPGVVEIYDFGHALRGGAYIAMELLEGETLAQRIAARGTLALGDTLALARRIAGPLAAAHAAGVVHRDLKPDNVVVDAAGQVKLIDFGIAKLDGVPEALRTTAGMVVGTPAYMAPEQCVGIGECDHRADLYALGCLIFEMLVGKSPFGALPARAVLAAHVRGPVPDLAERVKVPAELSLLVDRLLAKDPADRPRDAVEVADQLSEIESWVALAGSQTARQPAYPCPDPGAITIDETLS